MSLPRRGSGVGLLPSLWSGDFVMDVERAVPTPGHNFDDLDHKVAAIHASIRQMARIIIAECLLIVVGIARMLASPAR